MALPHSEPSTSSDSLALGPAAPSQHGGLTPTTLEYPTAAPGAGAEPAAATPEGAPEATAAPPPVPPPARRGWNPFRKRGAAAEPPASPEGDGAAPAPPKKRRRRRSPRAQASASWAVSLVVHCAILGALGLATLSSDVRKAVANINSALMPSATKGAADELLHVLATPGEQRDTKTVGSEGSPTAGGASGEGGGDGTTGIGTGPPSATPRVAGVGKGLGKGNGLPGVKVVAQVSGLSMIPTAARLGVDLGGGGMISGDVTYEAKDVGVALDQVAREILRHLGQHKLTVVWLFDESESMKDDQKAVKEKFDRVATELKINVDTSKKGASPLNHAIVGFGKELHYELEKPTFNIDLIGRAIDRLKIDDTGVENTMHAIAEVIDHYSKIVNKERKLLIVLVTDESGDDGDYIEEAHQAAMSRGVPIYVIGRQALFGLKFAHLLYIDPVTKEHYYPAIRRGPEAADIENLQWDGLHDRRDEQPSGFAPYELARLAKDTGGIYFLLPSEESMRIHKQEALYSIKTLKEYVPDYGSRADYQTKRNGSELRRTLYDFITTISGTSYRLGFPVNLDELMPALNEAGEQATVRLNILLKMQKRLEDLAGARDRENDKRWQAHYDLMLAQLVAYQVKTYEYRACLKEIRDKKPKPSKTPNEKLRVWWQLGHSNKPKADKEQTAKKYAEATALFKTVLERHPNTPWSDLAKAEMARGFSVAWGEASHVPNPAAAGREKFVPKY